MSAHKRRMRCMLSFFLRVSTLLRFASNELCYARFPTRLRPRLNSSPSHGYYTSETTVPILRQ